jgi:hypothetical protein
MGKHDEQESRGLRLRIPRLAIWGQGEDWWGDCPMNEEIAIRPLFTEFDVEIACRALVAGCTAKKQVRQRNEQGKLEYVSVDDHPTQIVSATKVIEFTRGKAVSLNLNANLSPKGGSNAGEEFLRKALSDPDSKKLIHETLKRWDSMEVVTEQVDTKSENAPSES